MATVEQNVTVTTNGSGDGPAIAVDNPATGETITHVPDLSAEQVADIVARARAAQPMWTALSYDDRAALMYELRSWLIANRERVLQTIMGETGKAREDAMLSEVMFVADSLGFW